jgi:rubrerythrin
MQNFQTTRDVLQYIRLFHRTLADHYQRMSDRSGEERLKMVLDYMSRHESGIENLLVRYEENASQKILDSWFQFTEEQSLALPHAETLFSEATTVEEIISSALEIDDCLLRFYRALAECSHCSPVRDLFGNLLEMVEQEKHHKIRTALGSMDL